MEKEEHCVGERCCFEEHKGTIRYVGEVPPTTGTWYGIEWDDSRGKHDGTSNDVRYFTCSDKHGSFVRPHKIQFGIDAIMALEDVYGVGVYEEKKIVLNEKTNQETSVEMVGFDKIAQKMSNFEALKDVDLVNVKISHANIEKGLETLLPKLTSLSLRDNLISSMKNIFNITSKLKLLKDLTLSKNKITDWNIASLETDNAYGDLQTLYINQMGLNWEQLLVMLKMMKHVVEVHACFNDIREIRYDNVLKNLQTINLEGNHISSWQLVLKLSSIPKLRKLILNNNKIDAVEIPSGMKIFESLESLSLSENVVTEWTSVNEISKLANLSEFRFKSNPVCKDITSFTLRHELIARLKNINLMNGSKVNDLERRNSELYYIKKYSTEYFHAISNNLNQDFENNHPRYLEFVKIHGPPQTTEKAKSLKDNLLLLSIKCPDCEDKKPVEKKVPGTMTIQQLKGIIQRLFKVANSKQNLSYIDTKNNREIALDDNMKQLTYYSVESGDTILLRW